MSGFQTGLLTYLKDPLSCALFKPMNPIPNFHLVICVLTLRLNGLSSQGYKWKQHPIKIVEASTTESQVIRDPQQPNKLASVVIKKVITQPNLDNVGSIHMRQELYTKQK